MGKKLIEVAPFLPLDAISVAASADKDKKTGTIKNVHKWFAPMPTPALRALIFGAVVNVPDDPQKHAQLLDLVRRLVPPDGNPPDKKTLDEAKAAIAASAPAGLPTIFDPFCGGGSTLVEAQRLGLPALGSDLNPVPVLITRTLTELLPQVAGRPPLVGETGQLRGTNIGPYAGLIADVKHYAEEIRASVWRSVGDLYPPGPNDESIIAWLWAWTTKCPNPACRATMPLVTSFWLSKKKGDPRALVAKTHATGVDFEIGLKPEPTNGTIDRAGAHCLVCGTTTRLDDIRESAGTVGMGLQMLCAVGTKGNRRTYISRQTLPPIPDASTYLDLPLPEKALGFRVQAYGIRTHHDLYTKRQRVMLEAFAEQIEGVSHRVMSSGGDEVYARTLASVLGLALGKLAGGHSTQARWYIGADNGSSRIIPAFGRHAMPMVWDFVEQNPFGTRSNNWIGQVDSVLTGLKSLPVTNSPANVRRADARSAASTVDHPVVVITDPPYFDQIGYADLSDYFYVWHRRALRSVHRDLYRTIVTPKESELIATPFRHNGDKDAAARYFVDGFTETFKSLRSAASAEHPMLIVYAHRQEEKGSKGKQGSRADNHGLASTGWDAMLEAVLAAGLTIEGTLPIRGTHSSRQIGLGTNSLASYIVMVCRPRSGSSSPGNIADFRAALRALLPPAVEALLSSGESMVDIRQAAIGPGMEVFSQFTAVFDGTEQIRVRRALSIINEELGRLLDEHLGSVDDETRWACQWFADHGFEFGDYDDARKRAQTYGLGVDGLASAGIVEQGRGKVRLLRRAELPADWMGDDRTPAWEAMQYLVKRLIEGATAGEQPAATLLAALKARASGVRELAQFLTNLSIEKGWHEEAIAYDALVTSWPRIEELAGRPNSDELGLF